MENEEERKGDESCEKRMMNGLMTLMSEMELCFVGVG